MTNAKKHRVVIIDDDDAMRHSFTVLLDASRMTFETYGSAEEFLERCDVSNVACIILDLRLPGMSGIELLSMLTDRNITVPVVVTTGYGDDETERRVKSLGAVALFEKPFDGDDFVAMLERIVNAA